MSITWEDSIASNLVTSSDVELSGKQPMSGKNRWLVADEPVELETSGNLPIILEESIE